MANLQLPPAMAALRPELSSIVSTIEAKAPYGSVWLSTRKGRQIGVNNREERVREAPHYHGGMGGLLLGVTSGIEFADKKVLERPAKSSLTSTIRGTWSLNRFAIQVSNVPNFTDVASIHIFGTKQ